MTMWKASAAGLAMAVLATAAAGCAHDEGLREDIARLRQEVAELNRNVADAHVRLEELDNRLHIVHARLEEARPAGAAAAGTTPVGLKKVRLVPEERPGLGGPDAGETASQAAPPPLLVIDGERPLASAPAAPPRGAASGRRDETREYEAARSLYKAGRREEARAAFDAFAERRPNSEYADNAVFWSGVCYYELGLFDDAVVRLTTVLGMAGGNKQADAWYYLGLSHRAQGREERAQGAWSELTARHPDSEAARKVRRIHAGVGS